MEKREEDTIIRYSLYIYNQTPKLIDVYTFLIDILTIFFFSGLLLAYLHWKSQCLQLLEHVGVRIQVELWWTQNGSIQDSRWELEDASKLVGIFGNDEICSQRCKFFSFLFLFYSIPTSGRNFFLALNGRYHFLVRKVRI